MDVAGRLGIVPGINEWLNRQLGLGGSVFQLEPNIKHTVEEVCKRTVSLFAGKKYEEQWFEKSSAMQFYDKTNEEAYPGIFTKARIPIYLSTTLMPARRSRR